MGSRKARHGKVFAKRSLGQNFLVDQNYIRKITDQLGEIKSDLVIEIGPGRGALTETLAQSAGKLVAIELDTYLSQELRSRFEKFENVEILEADVLSVNLDEIVAGQKYESAKVIANLPYNISTPFLQRLTGATNVVSEAILMLQKEVVSRLTADPGNRERGFITVFLEAYFEIERLFDVPPTVFRPVPKVWSSVIRMRPKRDNTIGDLRLFRLLVSDGFRQKRKTILNNLRSADGSIDWKVILGESTIPEKLRPEALSLQQWMSLADVLEAQPGIVAASTRYRSGR